MEFRPDRTYDGNGWLVGSTLTTPQAEAVGSIGNTPLKFTSPKMNKSIPEKGTIQKSRWWFQPIRKILSNWKSSTNRGAMVETRLVMALYPSRRVEIAELLDTRRVHSRMLQFASAGCDQPPPSVPHLQIHGTRTPKGAICS